MIELDNIRLRIGDRVLFDAEPLRIADGWRTGITGRNGTGKSSLFRLLEGKLEPDQGELTISGNQRLAFMAQEVPALEITAIDYVLSGDDRLQQAQAQLTLAEQQQDGHAIALAHDLLDRLDAWSAPARAASLMTGLGFTSEQQQHKVASFSGGWRMRLNLAHTLMANADILLLDEPTNHLDLDAILWLGDLLKQFAGTLLLVSHDRHFLDHCVDHILHIEHQTLKHYNGNYSTFERQRGEQLAQQQKAFEQQQKQKAHLQSYIDRFRAKATKAKQAQSRIKALARLQLSAPAQVDSGFSFNITAPERMNSPLLQLRDTLCGYQHPLLTGVNLTLEPGSRIGLLGANGAGKSTLIKTLAGILPALGGNRTEANALTIGYFHQQQIDQLDSQSTPFATLQNKLPHLGELDVRGKLGQFGFQGDRIFDKIAGFSGGEKTRLALALLVQEQPAILLLDEPTNHLDLEMRDALAFALQDYDGALVLISHDQSLLDSCIDQFWLVANGHVTPFDDDLSAYANLLREQSRNSKTSGTDTDDNSKTNDPKKRRQHAAQQRQLLRPLQQKIQTLEQQLDTCEHALTTIETSMADDTLYQDSNKARLQQLLTEQTRLRQQHSQLETDLLDALEQMEALQQSLDSQS